ncbi:MAG: UTP--glucose-1-phosphate uridylyltransferase [Planctomycetaceae bacterium]|nr:UTP--glucose-1-phosphate uridylyltransferase [Planctomycetaceae bacterium]MBQ2822447.1 UTP--glucose-1-phosphate uridylyltransferase [Thermoguttaceae bacterium]MDO4424208.1 UTP--glucose-1-phosphate uridylyltransferase [Planctomycetia bacterium]
MTVKLAVIPVAGRGTRLIPLTKSLPKEMLPVGRKPVVQYVVEELNRCGLQKLLFITGPTKIAIENHFDLDLELINHLRETGKEDLLNELAFEKADLQYFYTRQRRQLGLGHAILCAESFVGKEPFVAALGDTILGINEKAKIVERMIHVFEEKNADCVIAFEEVPEDEVHRYGIAAPKDLNDPNVFQLANIVEKPAPSEAPSHLAVASRYVFRAEIFDYLKITKPGKNNEIQLTDAIQAMIADGKKVYGVRVTPEEHRFDIGNFESYFSAFLEFALNDPDHGEEIRKKLQKFLK